MNLRSLWCLRTQTLLKMFIWVRKIST
jgi:hypothetical protein